MGFVLDWQKKLGYRGDPFVEQPTRRVHKFLVGREEERERLNLFVIKQQRFGILQGGKGSGKTTLLLWVAQQLTLNLKIKTIIIDGKAITSPKLFFTTLLDASLNFIEKKFTKPQDKLKKDELIPFLLQKLREKRIIIIVDDAQLLARENRHLLQDILQNCPSCQVILSLERVLKEHDVYGKDQLKITLDDMSAPEIRELLRKRIELVGGYDNHPFDKNEMNKLLARSKKNLVKLLTIARNRAIELSIKAGPPPKPPKEEKPAVKKTEKAEKEQQVPKPTVKPPKPKKGRFSIRFVEKDEAPKPKKEKKEEVHLDKALLTPSTAADAELLGELVTNAEEKVEEEKDDSDIEVEDVIQSLVEELDEKKR